MCLQHDLTRLANCEKRWQMEFHPEKCQVLRVSKKTKASTICHDYILHGHTLEVVDNVKYLGVTISGNLKWDVHVSHITNKANSTLAVLKHNVRVSSQSLKTATYKALVRPHVEYCSTVWDAPTAHLTSKVEMVQHRSARWVYNKYRTGFNATGPTEMISTLDWSSLESRRKVARLCLLYKMRNNLVRMSYRTLLEPYPYRTKATVPHGLLPLDKIPMKLYFAISFFPHTVCNWNSLPHSVATAPSIEAFQGLNDVSSGLEVHTRRF